MASIDAPTLILHDDELTPPSQSPPPQSAHENQVKNIKFFPSDDRDAMLYNLRRTLGPDKAGPDIKIIGAPNDEGTLLSELDGDELPPLEDSAANKIYRYFEGIRWEQKKGSAGRDYLIFEDPSGKVLPLTIFKRGGKCYVNVNNAYMSEEDFVGITGMHVNPSMRQSVVCNSSTGKTFDIDGTSLTLLAVAIQVYALSKA